jgi:iron transport multicopper oxidase
MRRSTSLNLDGIFYNSQDVFEESEPFVNACPVGPGDSFVYEASLTNQAGTFWYHSELSTQYVDVSVFLNNAGVKGQYDY